MEEAGSDRQAHARSVNGVTSGLAEVATGHGEWHIHGRDGPRIGMRRFGSGQVEYLRTLPVDRWRCVHLQGKS